ncbi:MAG TPA: hypothetical protein VFY99_09325 [Solirubrobacterales bacterium]
MSALEERLRDLPVPEDDAAEERAWLVISAAYADRAQAPARRPVRRLVAAAAAAVAVAVLALTPAGAEVVDVVRDVVGIEDAQTLPELGPLPAAGELLVDSEAGPWIVRDDGSKHQLGDYGQSTFSAPRGLFVAATDGRRLVALGPTGEVRWTVTAPATVSDARWAPSGFRVAYRSGDDLRVVSGDGTGDHLVAGGVAPVAPAWRPTASLKLAAAVGEPGPEQLTYVDAGGRVHLVDADTGETIRGGASPAALFNRDRYGPLRQIAWSASGERFVGSWDRALFAEVIGHGPNPSDAEYVATRGDRITETALAPRGDDVAVIERGGGTSTIRRIEFNRGHASDTTLFAGPGAVEGLKWSPDGRWLLAGWRDADQWLFIRADRPRRLVAIDEVTEQFAPEGGDAAFPRVSGWVLPQR